MFVGLALRKKHHFDQEIDGPYAWRSRTAGPKPNKVYRSFGLGAVSKGLDEKVVDKSFQDTPLYPNGPKWSACLPPAILERPGVQSMLQESLLTGCITFRLPKSCAVAGGVLQHAVCVIEKQFQRYSPCIFKVGYTHNCMWRWSNNIYGYGSSRDKWSEMLVLYISGEAGSAAMLEAALIEKYQRLLNFILVHFSPYMFQFELSPNHAHIQTCEDAHKHIHARIYR